MDAAYESRRFVCETCKRRFSRKQLLTRHMASHSDARPLQCEACPKTYKYTKNLTRHVKSKHFSEWLYKEKSRVSRKCKEEDIDIGKFLAFHDAEISKMKESDREEGWNQREEASRRSAGSEHVANAYAKGMNLSQYENVLKKELKSSD